MIGMNILIVDNGTSYLPKLRDLLVGHVIEIKKFGDVDLGHANGFDFIVLSGGHQFPVEGNEKKFKNEIEIIQNAKPPILGICFGFELVAHAFGARLILMKNKEQGIVEIAPSAESILFDGIDTLRVYESHRWVVESLPHDLVELARSKDGIEIIQHRSRPVYGFQFHPEMFVDQTVGDTIFKNLFEKNVKCK